LSLLVTAAAASRSIGAGTPIARTCSVSTVVTVIPPGGSYFQLNWPGEGAPGNSPASRLTGVKRQISSRPVGTGWSSSANDRGGCRWLATVSLAAATLPALGWGSGLTPRLRPSAA